MFPSNCPPSPAAIALAEAKAAYHNLMTGTMPRVVVDQNGERVEFTAANKQALASYIASLEASCGINSLQALAPAQFMF